MARRSRCLVLSDANCPIAKRSRQPLRDHRDQPLMVADVRLIRAAEIHVGQLMRDNAEQVIFDGLRVKINGARAITDRAFAKHLVRWALHLDGPPFAVETEAERGTFAPLHFLRR